MLDKTTLQSIRAKNLRKIADSFGTIKALAIRLEKSPSQISDMIHETKSFGPKMARYIEEKLKLEPFSLDKDGETIEVVPLKVVTGRRVPVVSSVHAGLLDDMGQAHFDEWIDASASVSRHAWAMRVKGDSMIPEFENGQYIVVDPDRAPKAGDFVVGRSALSILPEATLKQYVVTGLNPDGADIFDLRPLNQNYPTLHSEEHKLYVVGVVVEAHKFY